MAIAVRLEPKSQKNEDRVLPETQTIDNMEIALRLEPKSQKNEDRARLRLRVDGFDKVRRARNGVW
jgi:hypothetical protein